MKVKVNIQKGQWRCRSMIESVCKRRCHDRSCCIVSNQLQVQRLSIIMIIFNGIKDSIRIPNQRLSKFTMDANSKQHVIIPDCSSETPQTQVTAPLDCTIWRNNRNTCITPSRTVRMSDLRLDTQTVRSRPKQSIHPSKMVVTSTQAPNRRIGQPERHNREVIMSTFDDELPEVVPKFDEERFNQIVHLNKEQRQR